MKTMQGKPLLKKLKQDAKFIKLIKTNSYPEP